MIWEKKKKENYFSDGDIYRAEMQNFENSSKKFSNIVLSTVRDRVR